MKSLHIIYASTSGHTEFVCQTLTDFLKAKGMSVEMQRAERVKPEDLLRGNVLLLASSTWNTGNIEGQLNPHMFSLLLDRAKDVVLDGKPTVCVALGDERYFYMANAAKFLDEFVTSHGGKAVLPTLKIINEPYGQEDKVRAWGGDLLKVLS